MMNNLEFNRYIDFVNKVSDDMSYSDSIRHLLYVIVPAFIIKYGMKNENLILNCFRNTTIYLSDNMPNDNVNAYFYRKIIKSESYYSKKFVVIRKNDLTKYITFIDSIIHEFNHAINSSLNEILIKDEYILLRTGLSHIKYDLSCNPILKDKSFVLEEVINTKQTIDVINIISDMASYNIENIEIRNLIMAINSEIKNIDYSSDAYYIETTIAKPLLENKTFFSTIQTFRLKGEESGIGDWFDSITGNVGDYSSLVGLFWDIYELGLSFSKGGIFNFFIIRKIRKKRSRIEEIISLFNNNCFYK